MVARAFTAGLAVVLAIALLALLVLWPRDPSTRVPTQFASDVVAVHDGLGPPPNREDLISAICTGFLANPNCVHELMPLYRACGADAAHPRTPRCAGVVARVRREAH